MLYPRYKRVTKTAWVASLAAGLLLLFEQPTHAYIDPGTGSLIYQALLAGALGLVFTFRRTVGTVVTFVRGVFGRHDARSEGPRAD